MASQSTAQYVRLRSLGSNADGPADEAQDANLRLHSRSRKIVGISRRLSLKGLIFLLSVTMNFTFVLRLLTLSPGEDRALTYSPASKALRSERVVFSSAFGIERSPFQGQPSDVNNKLWAELYDFGITRISVDEARPMDNKTLPIPDAEGGYVVQLAVFHQLHCLNLIRKGIYGGVDMSNADDLMGIEHLDHCIDMLRQGIMCASDVTPITFSRTSPDDDMKVVAEVVHTCRSFSQIQQWAWNRRVKQEIDKRKIVTDDPLGWGTYIYSP